MKFYTNYANGGIVHFTDDKGVGLSPLAIAKAAVSGLSKKISDSHSAISS